MQLIDRIIFAIHNLWHNKSRSLLTIIIVFVVSTLILIILLIGINFSQNLNRFQQKAISAVNPKIVMDKYKQIDDYEMQTYFTLEDIDFILEKTREYQTVNHSLRFLPSKNFVYHPLINQHIDSNTINQISNTSAPFYTNIVSFAFPMNNQKRLIDGRIWSLNDVGLNYIWVNSSFVNEQFKKGKNLRLGDVLWLHSVANLTEGNQTRTYSQSFILRGIIDDGDKNSNVYLDMSYMVRNYYISAIATRIETEFYPPKSDYKFSEVYNLTNKYIKEIRLSLENNSSTKIKITSDLIEQLKITKLISLIVVGLSIILSGLIMLLSIGSVANTIVISVDKNKKFIGLLKAIGLKQKEVVSIVHIEAIFTISIGVLLSTIIILFNANNFEGFLASLFTSLNLQSALLNLQVNFIIPVYLPLIVISAFLCLALVFSKGSLAQIAKMDVINIISEVS